MDLFFSDIELCILRALLVERITNIQVTIRDCGLAAQKDDEILYCHFKHECDSLIVLYNKLCSHE